MRVLLSGYACDPNGGSESANTWYTAYELARAGAEVHLLTRTSDEAAVVPALTRAAAEAVSLSATFLPDDVTPRLLGLGQVGVYARYAAFQRRVREWAIGSDVDIGHHISWGSINHPVGLSGAVTPLVLGPVGGGQALPADLAQWVGGPLRWQYLRNLVLARGTRLRAVAAPACRHADLVLVTNWETERLAYRMGAGRTAPMLADGVRGLPPPPVPPERPLVVWLGRLLPIKGVSLAVAAFRHCLRSVPDAQLWIVGDGPGRRELESGAADLVGDGAVRLIGELPWTSAQDVLRTAKAHLFTGLRDSFSAQTLEAAAAGVPTVGIDQFGLRMFCHREGFVLAPPSPGGSLAHRLGAALVEVLRWPAAQWEAQSRAARAFASEHTYRVHSALLLEAYEALLG